MDGNLIYGNPPILNPTFLFVELARVEVCKINDHQASVVEFHVAPATTEFGGDYLYANLYHTPNAEEKFWTPCRATFGFEGYDIGSAIGRWGKIYLVQSNFRGGEYSTIQFARQTEIDKKKVTELSGLAKLGAIPWEARDRIEAEDMIREAVSQAKNELGDADEFRW